MQSSQDNSHPKERHNRDDNGVVMVPYPLQGHINPMLQLATILHSKGLSIIIAYVADINPPNTSNHPEFTYLPLRKVVVDDTARVGPVVDGSAGGVMELTASLNETYKVPFEKSLREFVQGNESVTVKCIIYDAFMYCAQSVADQWNIPGITLRTSAAASILGICCSVRVPTECLLEDHELKKLELNDTITKRLGLKSSSTIIEVKVAVATAFTKPTAIIVNTMGFLEQAAISKAQELLHASVYAIGPFHKFSENLSKSNSLLKEDSTCIAWLDQHPPKSVLYVSFGSLASMTKEDLLETAMGLVESDQAFLWVIRPGLVQGGQEWTEILPINVVDHIEKMGCVVGWAPQRQVLAHSSVGGFWTHCGWNSTMEGVSEGVPMICRPFFGDQFWNANYITKVWKVGIKLEDQLEMGDIKRAIMELMVGVEGQRMRERSMDLKSKANLSFTESGLSHKYVAQLVALIKNYE